MDKPEMSIDEALKIVTNVFANVTAKLADHQAMQMAIETIKTAVTGTKKEGKK